MTLENIMLSDISQTQKEQVYTLMIPFDICRISTFRGRKCNEFTGGWGKKK